MGSLRQGIAMSYYAQPDEPIINWVTGQPFPPPTDYSYGNLSPDIAIVMCRKPLTIEQRYFLNFGTAMPKDKSNEK
jgi:hypothetical protein